MKPPISGRWRHVESILPFVRGIEKLHGRKIAHLANVRLGTILFAFGDPNAGGAPFRINVKIQRSGVRVDNGQDILADLPYALVMATPAAWSEYCRTPGVLPSTVRVAGDQRLFETLTQLTRAFSPLTLRASPR